MNLHDRRTPVARPTPSSLLLFSRPTESGYQTMETADVSRPVAPPGLAEVQVDLAGLF